MFLGDADSVMTASQPSTTTGTPNAFDALQRWATRVRKMINPPKVEKASGFTSSDISKDFNFPVPKMAQSATTDVPDLLKRPNDDTTPSVLAKTKDSIIKVVVEANPILLGVGAVALSGALYLMIKKHKRG
jgi:hypothetical protein